MEEDGGVRIGYARTCFLHAWISLSFYCMDIFRIFGTPKIFLHHKSSFKYKFGWHGVRNIQENDRDALMEGGISRSSSVRSQHTSVRSNLFRFISMDNSFLLEHRELLRAMAEFGAILIYFYICDRTNLFSQTNKNYRWDLFLYLYILLIIVSIPTSLKKHNDISSFTGKSILYMNRHQIDEWRRFYSYCTTILLLLKYIMQ